ncbi:MAG: MucR family transcriptional regulator [Sphingobium sp.]|uniref:MucR family transcriptional regulator n=1 Tax=Sphingobium sp. TaxID=1912891 RepID=UPI002E1DD1BC
MDNAGANIARLSAEQQRSWAPAFADTIKPSALEAMRDAIVARMQAEGLAVPDAPAAPAEKPTPAVPLRASVKPDYIACLECGAREVQLKRHLRSAHGLQPGQYIAKWGLPADYPLVAPNHAEERREQAMKLGLKGGAK